MQRLYRILGLTAGLAIAGAALGALCGASLMMLADIILSGSTRFDIAEAVAARVGALLGAVLAPTSCWLLMRHVPLWRAILQPTIGTCIGALMGILFGPGEEVGILLGFGGALIGFVVSATWLRFTKSRGERRSVEPAV